MIRVHVICEGQTEEMFIKEILYDSLYAKGIFLYPSLIGKPGHKGGNFKFERLLTDLRALLFQDTTAYCTTFFDFYGLPADFPGKSEAQKKANCSDKYHCLLRTLIDALKNKLGEDVLRRFIPYVQMHEFEGILFSDTRGLAQGVNKIDLADKFQSVRDQFISPEEINDDIRTAPSKKIKALFSEYEKPIHGSLAALEIGLDAIRRECRLFDAWVKDLEALGRVPGV